MVKYAKKRCPNCKEITTWHDEHEGGKTIVVCDNCGMDPFAN